MKKIFISLVFAVISFFVVVSNVQAEDMRISCEGGGENPCNIDFGSPLFNIDSFAPGQSLIRQIVAINKDSTDNCDLTLYTRKVNPNAESDLFAAKLFTAIRTESTTLYGVPDGNTATNDKTFKTLLDYGGALSLGSVPKNGESKINWITTFDPLSDNDYQSKTLNFDFDISFVCGSAPGGGSSSSPTPTPVLGISTFRRMFPAIAVPTSSPSASTPTPEVKGAECAQPVFPWWIPLVLSFTLSTLYLVYLKRKDIKTKRWFILPLALVVLSQAIHEIIGCGCTNNINLCSKYLFINIALLIILYIYYKLASKKH